MSFNKFMHPRNPYKVPPVFKDIAIEYDEFRKHLYQDLSGKLKYNFKDPNALRVFTTTLLHKDFGLNVIIPESRLVPTLSLRLNYILWIEDLLKLNKIQSPVHGIDLGTGASCIYPLLGQKKNSWHMLALDTDSLSCEFAEKNVEENGLKDFIKVKNNSSSPHCLEPWLEHNVSYAFTMCNPPFYASSDELRGSKVKESTPKQRLAGVGPDKMARPPPANGHTGSEAELMAPGGEVAFVKQFVEANVHLGQIKIFTTMLGHKTSFTALKHFLSQHPSVRKVSTTEFCQGNTMRWGIAWTAHEEALLRDELPRRAAGKKNKPVVCVLEATSVEDVMLRILSLCDALKIIYKVLKTSETSVKLNLTARENTWSNQRRRKRQKLKQENTEGQLSEQENTKSQLSKQENTNNQLSEEENTKNQLSKQEDSEGQLSKQEDSEGQLSKREDSEGQLSKQEDSEGQLSKQENTKSQLSKQEDTKSQPLKQEDTKSQLSKHETSESYLLKEDHHPCEKRVGAENSGCKLLESREKLYVEISTDKNSIKQHRNSESETSKSLGENVTQYRENDKNEVMVNSNGVNSQLVKNVIITHDRENDIHKVMLNSNGVNSQLEPTQKIQSGSSLGSEFRDTCCEPRRKKARCELDVCDGQLDNCDTSADNARVTVDASLEGTRECVRSENCTLEITERLKVCVSDNSPKNCSREKSEVSAERNGFKAPLAVCNLLIEKLDSNDQIAIELIWISGCGSRELPHQIMQYLKNNI